MFEVIIVSNNNIRRHIAISTATATIRDICAMPAVTEFFDAEPQEIEAELCSVNGSEVPNALLDIFLTADAGPDTELLFGLDSEDENPHGETVAEEAAVATGGPGTVKVLTSGGLSSVDIGISHGITLLSDVVFNDMVQVRSGMTRDQIANCNILWNENIISAESAKSVRVSNGDVVELTLPSAARKGHAKG